VDSSVDVEVRTIHQAMGLEKLLLSWKDSMTWTKAMMDEVISDYLTIAF
jgi:hypothetical protein